MQWAQITWIFLHTFAEKINSEFFIKKKLDCLGLIKYVLYHLPCPVCTKHATGYLKKYNIMICKTKEDLKKYLWNFHNDVNRRLKKKMYKFKNMDIYKKFSFVKVTRVFLREFEKPYYYTAVMNSWIRKKVTKKLRFYLNVNVKQFS